jgi:integrase
MSRKKGTRSKGSGTLFKRKGSGPWIMQWHDHAGRRKERSTRTTDKAAAERILSAVVADAALRRGGVIDARQDQFATEGRRPIAEHVETYIQHCEHIGQNPRHVYQKGRELELLLADTGVARLAELTADALEARLRGLKTKGRSARTINAARQHAVAFLSWCVETGRTERNPLKAVPKLNESQDRRRVRRALTDDELSSLLAVARERGREAWYMTAVLAGFRKGDLQRLTWRDVDFEAGTLTVRGGKSKREDVVPMNAQLAGSLKRHRTLLPGLTTAKVFPETVTDRTRQKDFLRAGLAREEIIRDANGEPLLTGKGKPMTRIVTEDEEGRVIDLHAMRTTLGTNLARSGVAPQIARQIMRHANYETTLKHYTVLGLADTAGAVAALPEIKVSRGTESAEATGTLGLDVDPAQSDPQLYPQQLARDSSLLGATRRNDPTPSDSPAPAPNPVPAAGLCNSLQGGAVERLNGLEPSTFSLGS